MYREDHKRALASGLQSFEVLMHVAGIKVFSCKCS